MIKSERTRIKHLYYYVRPCPSCGSECTGRYMKRPIYGAGRVEEDSLKHGEIVRFMKNVPESNCFCVDCGFEFRFTVRTRWLTKEELLYEKEVRGTEDAYEELRQENRETAYYERKRPVNKVFNWIFSR